MEFLLKKPKPVTIIMLLSSHHCTIDIRERKTNKSLEPIYLAYIQTQPAVSAVGNLSWADLFLALCKVPFSVSTNYTFRDYPCLLKKKKVSLLFIQFLWPRYTFCIFVYFPSLKYLSCCRNCFNNWAFGCHSENWISCR